MQNHDANIPFRAALFDLDGTLLDSMYVWARVDEEFFCARCMPVPKDYGRQIAGKSYRESAEYTVEHYCQDENWQDIVDEWSRLSRIEYAEHVELKPGALAYLRLLKRSGVKLAVTTALPPSLYEPCLARLGILELFDECCSCDHTDGRGKASGEIFLLAANRLGVEPCGCAVFEDVLPGIEGAKRVGMRAYCVKDDHAKKDHAAIAKIADGMVDTLDEMASYHPFPRDPRCVIFTAYCEGDPDYHMQEDDFILCADAGWRLANRMGIVPDLVIGDFDSSQAPEAGAVERFPVMKDDTDTMLCLKQGLRMGYDRFLILGGFGGRVDHTLANIQTMDYAAHRGAEIVMQDGYVRAQAVREGSADIPRRPGELSVLSLSDKCEGVDISGAVWCLKDASLTNDFPLGVSNDYAQDIVKIRVKKGTLLIVQTDDRRKESGK